MPFIAQGKTNLKYILIVAVLAVLVGGGILTYQCWWLPKHEIKPPEITIKDETADWQTYRNEEYGFEFKYPEDKLTLMPTCDMGMYAPSTPTPAERCGTLILVKKGTDYPIGPPPKSAFMFLAVHNNTKSLQLETYIQEYLETTSHPYKGKLAKEVVAGKEAYTFTYIGKGWALLDYTEKQKWTFINMESNKVLSIENNFTVSNEMFSLFEKVISKISFPY